MNAKEMFEELGYDKPLTIQVSDTNNNVTNAIYYVKEIKNKYYRYTEKLRIWFFLSNKTYGASYLSNTMCVEIDEPLRKAIHQQMIELGWL